MRARLLSPLTAVAACFAIQAAAQESATYTYDALGRLTGSNYVGGPRGGKQASLAYDPAGNRTGQAFGLPLPSGNNAAAFSISGPQTVSEGQAATFFISKSIQTTVPLSVVFATVSGTAASPGDFTAATGTLTFAPWETQKTVSIPILNDNVAEGAETFSVSLSNATSPATIITVSASTTILASGPANLPPVPQTDVLNVGTCTFKTISPTSNDTDPESNYPLYIVSIANTSLGEFSFNSTEAAPIVSFAAYGGAGSQSVSYQVKDSLGAISTGQINVTVVDRGGCN